MRNSTLNPISKKQQTRIDNWSIVTNDRIKRLDNLCEWCGLWGSRKHEFNPLEGHHMIKRRFHNDLESNCFVCHRRCHEYIGLHNIKVYRGMKGIWAEGDERSGEKIVDS